NLDTGYSSTIQCGRVIIGRDPYYTPALQVERLAKFMCQKQTYIRYENMTWMLEQRFQFPLELEAQGVNTFLELHGIIYHSLVQEFYGNIQYKDAQYVNVVKGRLIIMDEELFLEVGGLTSDDSPLRNCNNELLSSYDSTEMNKSCLRGPHYSFQCELTKVGTTHAQPTLNGLKLMYVVKEEIMINWPTKILKVMYDIASSSSRFLAYGIFISRDICNTKIIAVNPREHLIDDDDANPVEENQTPQPDEAPNMPQEPSFSFAYLVTMKQRCK
ncbi:hypothetical protein Lal_00042412, partial [Lupinus albus]